jgi:decaprenylphospho-beta-D-erythro-pentofuranosid-2-ulose 2-reductase
MQRVLILGATSAIAGEVAEIYAKRGDHLCLVGRNREKLDSVVSRCTEASRGAKVTSQQADFAKLEDNEGLVERAFSELGGVDTVLIAHGDLGDQLATERTFDEAERTLKANLLSAVALLIPIANRMEASRGGRIGVITSVAGERGRPRNYTYGTAKGALNVYLQGLRSRLYDSGVSVTTLKLGPVDTPMTKDHAKHALFGKPSAVARGIVRALDARTPEAFVPSFWRVIMPIVRGAPESLFQRISFLSGR